MKKQHPLTLVTPVITSKLNQLVTALQTIRKNLDNGAVPPFEATGTIHYARLLLLKPEFNAQPAITSLVFSTDYDGDEEAHLTDLATKLPEMLDQVYDCCEGYPEASMRNIQSRRAFLCLQRTPTDSFYVGAPGRTLQQIRKESKLRDHLWELMKEPKWKTMNAKQVHGSMKDIILQNPEFTWAKEKVVVPRNLLLHYIIGIPLGLSIIGYFNLSLLYYILMIVGILVLFVVGWILMLHFVFEVKDKPLGLTPSQIDEAHLKKLEEYEDIHNQNQFSQLCPMRPGKIRSWTYKALMYYAIFKIHVRFQEGKLMGIPTIHFARWLRVQNNEQVLFFSNFDGSWQQYLGDFIDKSGWGLTGIFSNTVNFPVTRYLFWGGAYDEEHFLAWSRYYQIPTNVWYCAYPKLSIKNVNNNSAIRQELIKDLNEKQAQNFLKRF